MTAPNRIKAWVWDLPYQSKHNGRAEWNSNIFPSEQAVTEYIRADAPELLALVAALKMARELLEPFADPELSLGLGDNVMPTIDAALSAYEALQ